MSQVLAWGLGQLLRRDSSFLKSASRSRAYIPKLLLTKVQNNLLYSLIIVKFSWRQKKSVTIGEPGGFCIECINTSIRLRFFVVNPQQYWRTKFFSRKRIVFYFDFNGIFEINIMPEICSRFRHKVSRKIDFTAYRFHRDHFLAWELSLIFLIDAKHRTFIIQTTLTYSNKKNDIIKWYIKKWYH